MKRKEILRLLIEQFQDNALECNDLEKGCELCQYIDICIHIDQIVEKLQTDPKE